MKASLVAVLLAETVGIMQCYVEVTLLENQSAVMAAAVCLAVCVFSFR